MRPKRASLKRRSILDTLKMPNPPDRSMARSTTRQAPSPRKGESTGSVIHYCVTNMPGAVPRTSTQALCNATLPYLLQLANKGVLEAINQDPALAKGLNTIDGSIANEAIGEALGTPVVSTPSMSHAT